MHKNAKIYISGHTGLVGSSIVRKLLLEGYDNLLLKTRQELDLLDQRAVYNFFSTEKPEYVINCAARVGGIKANMTHQSEFLFENLQMQNHIIWGAHIFGVNKLLFLGSSCIYPRECPQPMREEYLMNGKLEPTNEGYALAKITGIRLCEKIYNQYAQEFISCMPTNIYGPGDNFDENSGHVIPALIRRMHEAKEIGLGEISIWGSGNSRREFLYVDDLANACIWLMNNYSEENFINIGTGEDISIRELAELIKMVVGFEGKLIFDISKPDGMPRKLLDVSKLHEHGWRHTVGLLDGVTQTYNSYKISLSTNIG